MKRGVIAGLALVLLICGAGGWQLWRRGEKEPALKVDVVIRDNQIRHIEILEHHETPGFDNIMVQLGEDIMADNSLQVEAVAGATETSRRFLDAVRQAVAEKGVDPDSLIPYREQERRLEQEKEETDCDILILGAGGAGLTAAIEARSEGKEHVILLEKMSFGGGNTRMSGGEYAAPGNWVQQQVGIEGDSSELFFQDIFEGGGKKGNPELIRILAQSALPNALWLRDYVGVEYRDYQSWYGGHTLARTLWPVGDGPRYVDTLIDKAMELGAEIHYNTRAEKLLKDEHGRIIGVLARRGGKTVEYRAKKGVILATGGFGANVDMRMEYDMRWHSLDENIPTTNSPAIVGDGLIMAREAGASLIGMGDIQLYPINNPATGNYYFMDYARLNSNALLVNRNGQRFVDEKGTRDRLAEAILRQPDAKVYELIDSQVVQEMNLEHLYEGEIARCLDQGVLVRGNLEECCKFFDLPLEAVKNTIVRFNGFAENGEDTDFGRTNNLEKIGDGPYYLFLCVVSVHHTMCGVEIDREARVLDTSGNVIPGLYGAGEVTGGIHGENRLGSMSMPDTVTFGRIAARSACQGK